MNEQTLETAGGRQSADDVSWQPPARAVHPVNHFHTLYMRLTEIGEGLLAQAADPTVSESDDFAFLLGACGSMSNQMAQMTRKLEEIRRDSPKVWDAWRAAARYQPPEEKEQS